MEKFHALLERQNSHTGEFHTIDEMLVQVSDGWYFLINEMWRFKELIDKSSETCSITSITIDKGLLRFEGKCSHTIDQQLFDRLTHALALNSSMSCMICSQRGYRRKLEKFWPCLCGLHYVEYINYLDDIGYYVRFEI